MPQIETAITRRTFQRIVRPAIGLPVSRPWLGYGDVLFLELGVLRAKTITLKNRGTFRTRHGQAGILFHSSWRAESSDDFLFGSSKSEGLSARIRSLLGKKVTAIRLEGRLPELTVELDRSLWIRGFSAWSGPNWDIALKDPVLFPRERRLAGDSLHVGYADEHGLARIVCSDLTP